MRKLRWAGLSLLAVGLLALADVPSGAADDQGEKKADKVEKVEKVEKVDQKAIDTALRWTLYDLINYGSEIYNRGDGAECCRIYQGALITASAALNHHPQIQKTIKEGLAEAARIKDKDLEKRAFQLREVLDAVRDELRGGAPGPIVPTPKPPSVVEKKTIWNRLGGEIGARMIVNDFLATASKDPKVNFDRNGKYKLDAVADAKLKTALVAQLSSLTGGPLKYNGDMKKIHKGMGITDEEFEAAAEHLKKSLEKNGVASQDVTVIMVVIKGMLNDIVEPKKPEPPTPEPKKPEEKPASKELHGKVTVDGKPLASGKITYIGLDNKPISGDIKDGKYTLPELKAGTYKVTIEAGDKVNQRYALAETTPLIVKTLGKETDGLDWEVKP